VDVNQRLLFQVSLFVVGALLLAVLWWNFHSNQKQQGASVIEIVASKLELPEDLSFLPDGSILFSERPGRLRMINADGLLLKEPLLKIDEVANQGEGGLLGIAIHPDFATNWYVYLYYNFTRDDVYMNKVVRYTKTGNRFLDERIILDGIPGSSENNGGKIAFGPDRLLYITTGDASNPALAQDINSLAGKILRLNDDGSIPSQNPFPDSPVFSLGHRNSQGLAWDNKGRLWETEQGVSGKDEINLIQPGANYGWPVMEGKVNQPGMHEPFTQSDGKTWDPAGCIITGQYLTFTGLNSQCIWRLDLEVNGSEPSQFFSGKYGRLRNIIIGHDKYLYLCTNNRDGYGTAVYDDDRILKIDPSNFE